MKTGTTNIKLNYKPLNAVKSLKILSGSERQNYNADTMTFEPDRRIDPLVVMVECGVTDPHNLKNGNVNADLNSVSWKISENGILKDILESDSDFKIGKNANKGQLTIYKNISDLEPVTILFTAKYLEPISKRVVNFQEDFDLITLPIAQTPVTLEATTPVGGTLFVNKDQDGLLTQARLFRGIEQLPAAYYWYKGNTEISDANGYIGSKTEKLFVPSSEISSSGSVIRVEVADCSNEINKLVKKKVEEDVQVIEWRALYITEPYNLLNSDLFENNKMTGLEGVIQNSSTSFGSGFQKINERENYIVMTSFDLGDNYTRISFHDENKSFITRTISNSQNIISLKAPVNAKYIYISFETGNGIFKKGIFALLLDENKTPVWKPTKKDISELINEKTEYYKSNTSLPENYRPATKPAKTYKSDYLLIKKFPEYKEEVLITQGGIDPSVSSVQVEMIIKTNDGVMQNPEKYFSVGWLKRSNGTLKHKGFKVNIPMSDIVVLNDENIELYYELREDLTLKV